MWRCYRGVEAIRHLFGEGVEGWAAMHTALRTDRAFITSLEAAATGGRHGDNPGDFATASITDIRRFNLPRSERYSALQALRDVIVRALEWIKLGRPATLPEDRFPLLNVPPEIALPD